MPKRHIISVERRGSKEFPIFRAFETCGRLLDEVPVPCIVSFGSTSGRTPAEADALGSVQVKHTSGGWSTIIFKSYDQRREKFQGESLSIVALDEECSLEIYTECLARISATGGMLMAVFTSLLGLTDVVRRYMEEESPDGSIAK